MSRFFRLYPAFCLSLLALILVLMWEGHVPAPHTIAANITMTPKLLGAPVINVVYWTLLIEIVLYALYFVLRLLGLLGRSATSAIFAILLALFSPAMSFASPPLWHDLQLSLLPFHLSLFFLGALFRFTMLEMDAVTRRFLPVAIAAVLLALPFAGELKSLQDQGASSSALLLAGVAAILLFAAVLATGRPKTGWLVRTGALSYSIYLLHIPVARLGFWLLAGGIPGAVGFAIWTAVGTILVSELVYRFVEFPCIAIGKRINGRLDGRLASEIAP